MFSLRLKALRESKEISQQALAGFLHYSQQSIAKWENGLGMPPADVLSSIASYFNVSVDYLIGHDLVVSEEYGEYVTAEDLVIRLVKHQVIGDRLGYDPQSLNENELVALGADVLAMIQIAARRFISTPDPDQ
ncbi:MAG: helix-turn-helix transcriptional regulator [Erysipelotrichaceae bacterium]|nr:helix-turn-helix transcriptional regulator [Erysipelotrichaceae bacterium]